MSTASRSSYVERRSATSGVLLLASGVAVGLALATGASSDAPRLAALTLLLTFGLLVTVPVPWGGHVPLGFALAIAVPAIPAVTTSDAAIVAAGAVALALVAASRGPRPVALGAEAARLVPALFAPAAAVAWLAHFVADAPVLHRVGVSALALLAVDVATTRVLPVAGQRLQLRSALQVYLTIACGAALIAVATHEQGVAMATVAAFPLLITRFSFRRYAEAEETLRQTVQALGLVPELAALAPLGHSERTAAYAETLAVALGFEKAATQRIVTAARLHQLGAVPFDPVDPVDPGTSEPPEPLVVAAQGALILREAGFPEDVAELIESARAGALDRPSTSLEGAVVRVASAFDDVVGEDPTLADRGLTLVSATSLDRHSRRAAAAMLELVATRPAFVAEVVAAGARFRDAAGGLDLQALVAPRHGADIVPFARRRHEPATR